MPVPVRTARVGAARPVRLVSRVLRPTCSLVRRQHVPRAGPNEVPAVKADGDDDSLKGFTQNLAAMENIDDQSQALAEAGQAVEDYDEDEDYSEGEYYSDDEDYYSDEEYYEDDEEEGAYYDDEDEEGVAAEYDDDDAGYDEVGDDAVYDDDEYDEEGLPVEGALSDDEFEEGELGDIDAMPELDENGLLPLTAAEKEEYEYEETENELYIRKQRIIANRLKDERATVVEGNFTEDEGWEDKVVQLNRVTKVLRGGKLMKFRAVVVSGNYNGSIGYGVASAREVIEAVKRASKKAKANAMNVPMTQGRTFPHKIQVKEGAARIMLRPAAPGTGVIAGGAVRIVLEMAGYQNAFGKILGTGNAMNNTRGTLTALRKMFTWTNVAYDRGVTVDFLQGLVDEPDEVLPDDQRPQSKKKENQWRTFTDQGEYDEDEEYYEDDYEEGEYAEEGDEAGAPAPAAAADSSAGDSQPEDSQAEDSQKAVAA